MTKYKHGQSISDVDPDLYRTDPGGKKTPEICRKKS